MYRCGHRSSSLRTRAATAVLAITSVGLLLHHLDQGWRTPLDARRKDRLEPCTAADVLRAAAAERAMIARELHDVLGRSLGVIVVQAGAAAQVVEDDPAAARRALESIRSIGSRSLEEMREVLAVLRGQDSERPGLDELPRLVNGCRDEALSVEFEELGQRPVLDPELQLALYRITQESLSNVRRHAAARTAVVRITHAPGVVHLSVVDDGPGGVPAHPIADAGTEGFGITGMRERAARHEGTLEAGPGPGGSGWQVRARLSVAGSA